MELNEMNQNIYQVDFHLHTLPSEELDRDFSFSMNWLKNM